MQTIGKGRKKEGREICLPKQSHVQAPEDKQPSKIILPEEDRETRVGSWKKGGCDHTFPPQTVIRRSTNWPDLSQEISWAHLGLFY